ncbi:hypothetical protein ACWKWU_18570 [Chitinophaga lutea]
MRTIFLFVAAFFTALGSYAADPNPIDNKRVLDAFENEFYGATDVAWYPDGQGFIAKFSLAQSKVKAHFDGDGNLIATIRYVGDDQLPLCVSTRLAKKYPSHHIANVVELVNGGVTSYVITLENERHWTILRSSSHASFTQVQKLVKQ